MLHHLKCGDRVLGIDNFCSSDKKSEHVKLINTLCENDKTGLLVDGDIVDQGETGLLAAFKKFKAAGLGDKFDVIYNFACPASPPIYQSIPVLTMMTCVVGTGNVLEMASEHGSRVIHASTSEVYGDPAITPQPEQYRGCVNSYGPRACYDEGKRAAEALCYDWLNSYNADIRLVRIFNTYGPNMDPHDGRVVSNFICQALRGEKLTIYGDGKQSRSFCYVDDLIRGIVAVGALSHNPKGPINLGNPNEFTMKELACSVLDAVYGPNRKFSISDEAMLVFKDLPVDDPTQRCPNIDKAKLLLGWEPAVQLSDGLDMTIKYFRSRLNR